MLNRKKCKKMWVWEDNLLGDKVKRIVISVNNDGTCLAVEGCDEHDFHDGNSFETVEWANCREAEKPKMRPMTRNEILGLLVNKSSLIVRHHGRDPQVPTFFPYTDDPDEYEWATITETGEIGEWHKFEVEDTE